MYVLGKNLILAMLVVLAANMGFAQSEEEESFEAELAELQQEILNETAPQKKKTQKKRSLRSAGSTNIILNNTQEATAATAVQQQPTTFVEASPLTESRAEQLRRARNAAEVQTEQKIVEKLENARLEDERRRAQRLFSNGFGSKTSEAQAAPVQPAVIQPAVIAPQIVVPAAPVFEEEVEYEDERNSRMYISAMIGLSEYDAMNVKSDYATGFSIGADVGDHISVEGGFLYSKYTVEYPAFVFSDLSQYNFNLAGKFAFFPGRVKPYIGGAVSYTYRKYAEVDNNWYSGGRYRQSYNNRSYRPYNNNYGSDEEPTSTAIDVGFLVGMDFAVSDDFFIGADYRQYTNLTNRSDSRYLESSFYETYLPGENPLEELEYYVISVSGKFRF